MRTTKNKKLAKLTKFIIAGSLLLSLFFIDNRHGLYADSASDGIVAVDAPTLPKVTWDQYSAMYMEGRGHTALTNNGNLLSNTASADNVTRDQADAVAKSYAKSAPFTSIEQSALTSVLPMKKADLTPVYNDAAVNGLLSPKIPKINTWWWTGEDIGKFHSLSSTLPQRKIHFASAVSPQNDTLGNFINGGNYTCVPPNGTGYVPNGCAINTYPGEVPLANFKYDGGYTMDTVAFNSWEDPGRTFKSANGQPVTMTSYFADGDDFGQRADYNTVYNKALNRYEISTQPAWGKPAGAQFLANYVEFDYPTERTKTTTYAGDETPLPAVIVDYNTFQPITSGTIPANQRLVLLQLWPNGGSAGTAQSPWIITANYVVFNQPILITGEDTGPNRKMMYMPPVSNIQRRHYWDARTSDNTAVLPPVNMPDVAVRPLISLNPDNILFLKNFDSGKDTTISQLLQTPIQFYAKAGNSYKPTFKDPSQAITDMTYDTTDTDILKIDYPNHKVYIKPTTKRLWLTVNGTYGNNGGTSYISGIGKNFASKQTVMARLGTVNPDGTNAVWLKVDNLINPAVIGNTATVNLYTEELEPQSYADYISQTPYTFDAVVASNQTIGLDDATKALNGSNKCYGDDINISAHIMKAPDKDDKGNVYPSIWDKTTPIKISIDTGDPADSDTAEIVAGSETWNPDTGEASAKVHFKDGIGGSDHKIKIDIDKAQNGGYLAAPRQQLVINVAKRDITITPIEKTMAVGDPYPPTDWQYSSVKTSDVREFGLVNGDVLPYQFITTDIGKSKGTTSPAVDGSGHISATAIDQQWGINLNPTSALDVENFMKKYDVILKDYKGGNHNSILDVKRPFAPIKNSDIVTQPTDIETQIGSKVTLSAVYTYPIKDLKNQVIDATYQNLAYQWYKKNVNGSIQAFTPTSAKMEILPNLNDKQGEAKFSFTIDPVQDDDNLTSYYIEVWNGMNAMTPVQSNTAQLTTIQEPRSYVQFPSKIEIKNDEATASVKGESSIALRTLGVDDKATPKGAFEIQTDPQVQLFLNGDTTLTDYKKIYNMGVIKADGTQVGKDKVLMNLAYPASLTSDFSLEALDKDKKDWGLYKGTMTFTLTYVPKGGTSP